MEEVFGCLVAISVFLDIRSPRGVGGNVVMTDCSKICGALLKLTMPTSTVSLEGRGSKCK